GTTPSVRRLIDAVDAERVMTREGWGYPAPHYELATYYDEARAAAGLYGAGARAKAGAAGGPPRGGPPRKTRRERALERDPHVRPPVRHGRCGLRPHAPRVRRPRGRSRDASDLGAPPGLPGAARARDLRARPRPPAPGSRRP